MRPLKRDLDLTYIQEIQEGSKGRKHCHNDNGKQRD